MKTPGFRVDGQHALITGGSRGIGLAAAYALTEAGASVCLAARDPQALQEAAAALKASGAENVQTWQVDVTDHDAVRDGLARLPLFQILVNSAGSNRPGLLVDRTDDDIDFVLDLNVAATIAVTREVVRRLIDSGLPGSIINLSSQYGHVGAVERSLYAASKHAIEGFTKSLAWEVGSRGIRVNSISPALIETSMTQARLAQPGVREEIAAKTALGRVGQPEDLMGAVLFLASDASSYVTGTTIRVDGGTTAV